MNLNKIKNSDEGYNVGLDMGTGSVGWAVADESGQLFHFKGQPTWGSRLFDTAQTAADARVNRGQRRRYVRRRWRLDLLQGLFDEEVSKVDPEFFIRLRQSRLLKEDREEGHRDYGHPLFNDTDFAEADYYKRFPTIYHLRQWLMKTDEEADIRLIYLAAHNVVKHRGNFLRQDSPNLSAKNASAKDALSDFFDALNDWCGENDYSCPAGEDAETASARILEILEDDDLANSDKKKQIGALIAVSIDGLAKESKACNEALAGAMVGLKVDFKKVFGDFASEAPSVRLSEDEKVEELRELIPDEGQALFEKLCAVHSAYVLQGILFDPREAEEKLSGEKPETLSDYMVLKYEKYGKDLATLKQLVREYVPGEYNSFFRGPVYAGTDIYDYTKAHGYTKYDLGTSKMKYEDFQKAVEKLFAGTPAVDDGRYAKMMADFKEQRFLRRLKTSDNGSICYQLHLEELDAILKNQGKHYSFLREDAEKIKSLVSFRIPYYVGPLSTKNAAKDAHEKQRFAWSERREGMEDVVLTPWNWDKVINREACAEKFITRMTGMCTYLQGEDVLPKCSLLYEEFCVLNELNVTRFTEDGDREYPFDSADRELIVEELFKRRRTVSRKAVSQLLERQNGHMNVHVVGTQGQTGFESKLSSYNFFCKDVFHVEELDRADYPMIEQIILWNTLFEDRKVLKEKLQNSYGPKGEGRLTDEQIKKICKKRFTGWGRLSRKFLEGLRVDTDCGRYSIMDVLRNGDPTTGHRQRPMNLMMALRDETLNFQKRVDEYNAEYFAREGKNLGVNDLPGSPAIRRSLNQTIRIVDEIAKIAGKAPKNIFIEVTRDDETDKWGHRTQRRYADLQDGYRNFQALKAFKDESAGILSELKSYSHKDLDERLYLYFQQRGKCLYCGERIDINKLSSGEYEVDHIIPRSYIKDDSFENKALVCRKHNQSKTNEMLIDERIRMKMKPYWTALHNAKLIGDKKYNNLLRDHIDDKALKGFVARQLVETSQSIKLVQSLLSVRYPDTKIVPVKASMSHDLREAAHFVKCREANDFHHAHDAYLACRMGMFIQKRHPKVYENPIAMTSVMRKYAKTISDLQRHDKRIPGSAGFIVNSFMSSGFNKVTGEIFKDDWNAEAEIEGIRKALNYRQCFITRMPSEDSGAFWDATIYSPRDPKMGKKLSLSLKDGLEPKKYGGYSSVKYAYFFVYEALDKKGRPVYRFAGLPVMLAAKVERDSLVLDEYARELAVGEKLEFVGIERRKLLKKQLIEIDGDRFLLTGGSEMRNARELAFTQDEVDCFSRVLDDELSLEERGAAAEAIFSRIHSMGRKVGSKSWSLLKIGEMPDRFYEADAESKVRAVQSLVLSINAVQNKVDLSMVGGVKFAGAIQPNYAKLLNDPKTDFYIIDQSVTGMFEKRTRIGL